MLSDQKYFRNNKATETVSWLAEGKNETKKSCMLILDQTASV